MGSSLLKTSISSNVKPIGLGEFVQSLSTVLKIPNINHGHGNGFRQRKIGLAISGGVDSMALALLCSQIQNISLNQIPKSATDPLRLFQGINFQAFVVDHGVRESSSAEAGSVSRILKARGIPTEVIKINWRQSSPANSPNFESLARTHRFQTLGLACRRFEINALLLAHHQDDQAETVFMRMAAGHRILGLTGIKGDSEIPECYGIHGIHESGGIDDAINHGEDFVQQTTAPSLPKSDDPETNKQLAIENGGVRIYRPLLDFSKARLRETCEQAKMEWFEDHTNKDPSLTMRNAVRHMYSTYSMPLALTKPAILELSQRCKENAASRLAVMNTWLAKCSISQFETRSGILVIRFPDLDLLEKSAVSTGERKNIAASLLRRAIMLVTPEEHVDLSSLRGAVQRIFPGPNPSNIKTKESSSIAKFTVAGVQFDPQPQHAPHTYLLSRQTYSSALTKQPLRTFPPSAAWSCWQLYDGRFWVRVRHSYESEICIQNFRKPHLKDFTAELNVLDRAKLQADLKHLAPANIRWTLPAIVLSRHGEKVLALPTLGFVVPDAKEKVQWEFRYKKVDLVSLPFAGDIV